MVFVPPWQVPDEPSHFIRVYQISDGALFPNEKTGEPKLPESLAAEFSSADKFKSGRQPYSESLSKLWADSRPLSSASEKRYYPTTAAGYSPVPYLPHILALAAARLFSLKTIFGFYMMRLAGLVAVSCLFALGFSIISSLSPRHGLVYVAAALVPMNSFECMGISADGMTNALSFLTIALGLFIMHRLGDDWRGRREYRLFLYAGGLLSLCKYVYFTIPSFIYIMLLLGNPPRRKDFLKETARFFGFALLPAIIWNILAAKLVTIGTLASPREQLLLMLAHPLHVALVLLVMLWNNVGVYMHSLVGNFGWLDVPCSPLAVKCWCLCAMVLPLFCDREHCVPMTWREATLFWGVPSLTYLLISGSLYVTWSAIGGARVTGIQGRYFIPVLILPMLGMPAMFRLEMRRYRLMAVITAVGWLALAYHCLHDTVIKHYWMS